MKYIMRSAKGTRWENHKYKDIVNGRYIYDEEADRAAHGGVSKFDEIRKRNEGKDWHDVIYEHVDNMIKQNPKLNTGMIATAPIEDFAQTLKALTSLDVDNMTMGQLETMRAEIVKHYAGSSNSPLTLNAKDKNKEYKISKATPSIQTGVNNLKNEKAGSQNTFTPEVYKKLDEEEQIRKSKRTTSLTRSTDNTGWYIMRSAKGTTWKEHLYTAIINGKYIYDDAYLKAKKGISNVAEKGKQTALTAYGRAREAAKSAPGRVSSGAKQLSDAAKRRVEQARENTGYVVNKAKTGVQNAKGKINQGSDAAKRRIEQAQNTGWSILKKAKTNAINSATAAKDKLKNGATKTVNSEVIKKKREDLTNLTKNGVSAAKSRLSQVGSNVSSYIKKKRKTSVR